MPQLQNQEIINQLEEIKERVMNLERALIEEEEPTRDDLGAIKELEMARKEGKLVKFKPHS